ncbi:MAG: tRNA (N6-isopentenyl adenosine(37)-C2)-methylthiotransferase MiaB [Candidatus Eisenbacteria bacterium]|nr:tRNA (N6-isopentenyl adenosine(37)-C2)-methylthiotransferase MiaB [Candidatus Eisenbacteria bacterium]
MNEYDSKLIRESLRLHGHSLVSSPERADAVVVNTCSVRERAEMRVLGRLRHLRGLAPPDAVVAVVGCVAQRLGSELFELTPVDLVVGTDGYGRLPELLRAARDERCLWTPVYRRDPYDERDAPVTAGIREFVAVMRGCDNYCTYCIVPFVRGRERSRTANSVLREVGRLTALGTKDITLLGQNVNSYRDGDADFPELLRRVAAVPGLERLRFATSHPKDLSDELIETIASTGAVCEHIHLPVQSGSDRVLASMGRSYDRERYRALVRTIRERVPDVALTTDIIVGFPGETADDYEETVSLMEEVRFDSAFMFRYSVRSGTAAADLADDVPEEEKIARLERIIELQKGITWRINEGLVGQRVEVLCEGPSQRDNDVLFGRTRQNKAVVFSGRADVGELVDVTVREASAWTLRGVVSDRSA